MTSRFAFVPYDEQAATQQIALRRACRSIETAMENSNSNSVPPELPEFLNQFVLTLEESLYKSAAKNALNLTIEAYTQGNRSFAFLQLEEAYYWVGKIIRLSQIERIMTMGRMDSIK